MFSSCSSCDIRCGFSFLEIILFYYGMNLYAPPTVSQQPPSNSEYYKRYLNPLGNPRACSSASAASLHRERCFLNAQHIAIDTVLVRIQMRYEFAYEGPQLDGQKYLRWCE